MICQKSNAMSQKKDSTVCAKPFSYFGLNHHTTDCFFGSKGGGTAYKRPTGHIPLSPEHLAVTFSNEGLSLYIFFDIFIWMCFYCAIFDGISVFRKKKRKKTQEKKNVGESSCQHSKSLLCKMYFCPGFECGIMSLNEQRISKRSLRLPLVKFAFLGLVQEYALKVSRYLTP